MTTDHSQGVLDLFRRAAEDRRHGASEIEMRLLEGLIGARSWWLPEVLTRGALMLGEGQPSMANLRSLTQQICAVDSESLLSWLEGRFETLRRLPELFASGAWKSVEAARLIVTVSRSGAVAAVVEGAWARGWDGMVVVLDGSPGGGGPEQAGRLAARGETVSDPDARAAHWLDQGDAVVVVGADALGTLRFVNCVGTRGLFELGEARGVDRLVVADTGKDVSEEVVSRIVAASPHFRDEKGRSWPLFEEVPSRLISARITESGATLC